MAVTGPVDQVMAVAGHETGVGLGIVSEFGIGNIAETVFDTEVELSEVAYSDVVALNQ